MNAIPAHLEKQPASTPANDRFKGSFRIWLWSSMIAATILHFGVFALWPTLTAAELGVDAEDLEIVDVYEIDIPEPPAELTAPAKPVVATTEIDEEITIERTTLEANPADELPPPPADEEAGTVAGRTITPYTVPPRILNEEAVVRAMERAYPRPLRDASIGGTVHVLFHIDAEGTVQAFRIDRSSGHESLDDAALSVAEVYRFSPALNRDKRVAVWVAFPVVFQVRE